MAAAPWVRRSGFMKYGRELPTRRPIPVRVLDWKEVYEDFPPEKVRTQGARCMDCGIPFCHTGCPLGNLIPEWNDLVYRDHWRAAQRAAARHQQLPRVHRPAVPGAVRSRVRARHQRAAGHDQADRGRDRRPRVGGGLDRAGRAPSARPASASPSSAPVRPVSRPRSSSRAPGHDVDRLRARRSHRRPAALRHPRVQDGEAPPRSARRADGRRGHAVPRQRATSARTCRSSEIARLRRGRARGRRDRVARSAGARAASSRASTRRWSTSRRRTSVQEGDLDGVADQRARASTW